MGGWGEPKGPMEAPPSPPASITGTTGQVEAARVMLHSIGIVGNNLAEEAFLAVDRMRSSGI